MDLKQYFYRKLIFSSSSKIISLVDIEYPEADRKVLEGWFGGVYQLADGKHSIEDLLQLLIRNYKDNPPENLKETIDSVIKRLEESNFIGLSDNQVELPYYLSMPYEILDIDKAKEMLKKDKSQFSN